MARSTKPTQSSSTRVETDSFGPIGAAADRHRGAQTDRSRQNFRIGRDRIDRTHTRHATPLTVGQELSDRAAQLGSGAKRLELAVTELVLPENQPTCAILSTLTYCMMHSIQLLAEAARSFAEHFVSNTLPELKQRSLMMVTTLAPNIGCDNAAKMTQSERARAELC